MPGAMAKPLEHPRARRLAEPQPRRRIGDQRRERIGQRCRIVGRHQKAVHAVLDQLRHRGDPARDHRKLHGARLQQHVRQAVAIAVRRDPAGQHEQIGGAVGLQHLVLRRARHAR